jgi:hypothetical protein
VHVSQAFASNKESVMSSELQGQPSFQNDVQSVLERDRQAWNLPSPRPQPVGPVRDVWPVRAVPTGRAEEPLEDPAAA